MKKLIVLSLFIGLVSTKSANGQDDVLFDVYTITEMYKLDVGNNTSVPFENDFFSNLKMVRIQDRKSNEVIHNVNTIDNEKTILLAYGPPIDCIGLKDKGEEVNERICYGGAVAGKFFDNNEGLLFIYESLKTPSEQKSVGKEYVSFTYIFFPSNIIQVYGYKSYSNYNTNKTSE